MRGSQVWRRDRVRVCRGRQGSEVWRGRPGGQAWKGDGVVRCGRGDGVVGYRGDTRQSAVEGDDLASYSWRLSFPLTMRLGHLGMKWEF